MLSLYLAAIDTAEEKSKFELLYQRYRDIMYWAAYGIMKDPHQAEDVVSQSFFKVIDHLNRITDVDSRQTKAFLVTITEHTAIDCYRKRKRERTVSMEDWEAVSSYTEEFEENDVISCINSLVTHVLYREILPVAVLQFRLQSCRVCIQFFGICIPVVSE